VTVDAKPDPVIEGAKRLAAIACTLHFTKVQAHLVPNLAELVEGVLQGREGTSYAGLGVLLPVKVTSGDDASGQPADDFAASFTARFQSLTGRNLQPTRT
jgi:hypothetical protein